MKRKIFYAYQCRNLYNAASIMRPRVSSSLSYTCRISSPRFCGNPRTRTVIRNAPSFSSRSRDDFSIICPRNDRKTTEKRRGVDLGNIATHPPELSQEGVEEECIQRVIRACVPIVSPYLSSSRGFRFLPRLRLSSPLP